MNETIKTQLQWQGCTFLMILEDRGKNEKLGFPSFYSFSPFSLWNPKTCLSSKGKNDFKRGGRVIFHTPDIVFDVLIFLIKMQECEFFRITLPPLKKNYF